MEQFISNSNAMLIQGMTERSLESMISRLLDEKLATIIESTPKVEKRPDNGLYRRKGSYLACFSCYFRSLDEVRHY